MSLFSDLQCIIFEVDISIKIVQSGELWLIYFLFLFRTFVLTDKYKIYNINCKESCLLNPPRILIVKAQCTNPTTKKHLTLICQNAEWPGEDHYWLLWQRMMFETIQWFVFICHLSSHPAHVSMFSAVWCSNAELLISGHYCVMQHEVDINILCKICF